MKKISMMTQQGLSGSGKAYDHHGRAAGAIINKMGIAWLGVKEEHENHGKYDDIYL